VLFFSPASSFSLRLDGLDGEWSSDLFYLWCFRSIDMSNKFDKFMRFKILFFNFFYGFMVVFNFFFICLSWSYGRDREFCRLFLIIFFKWFFVFNFWIIPFILYRWGFFYKKKIYNRLIENVDVVLDNYKIVVVDLLMPTPFVLAKVILLWSRIFCLK
jgi:hypothetical protein